MTNILETRGLTKRFGGLTAVDSVDFSVATGSITSLIGPNGAGKTTFFNTVTGLYTPTSGTIAFAGRSLVGLKPHEVTAAGIGRTFQNIRLFGNMTAVENVMVGMHSRMHANVLGILAHSARVQHEEATARAKAHALLDAVGLPAQRADDLSKNLPYGDQRRLEIARALATDPQLLLLDEPTAGMNPQETAELTQLIRRIRDERAITILLIEHDMKLVMEISESITVLDRGAKIAAGLPHEIRSNEQVIEAYLGRGAASMAHANARNGGEPT